MLSSVHELGFPPNWPFLSGALGSDFFKRGQNDRTTVFEADDQLERPIHCFDVAAQGGQHDITAFLNAGNAILAVERFVVRS